MPSKTDKEILELFGQPGCRAQAFQCLVEKYQKSVYWIIRRILINHEDTNDVMQNTFIKIWQKIPQFRNESGLYAWIYRIAVNQCYNFIRHKNRNYALNTEDSEQSLNNLHEDPWFDGNNAQILLQQAIAKLPHQQRIIFNMRYFENFSFQNIGEILEIKPSTVRTSYSIAVKKIKKN
ncbi:MAG: sigma-70 family RNA polymerase sigma factor, partial [Bacteroidales bacterium]